MVVLNVVSGTGGPNLERVTCSFQVSGVGVFGVLRAEISPFSDGIFAKIHEEKSHTMPCMIRQRPPVGAKCCFLEDRVRNGSTVV